MHVAIIGLGEVGRCYASALHASGIELSLCEARLSSAAQELAEAWRLETHATPGAWLASADWVLSCVTGAQALSVLEASLPHLSPEAGFADLTTARPDVKRQAAKQAIERHVRYVDTAIMGAISLNGARTPLLAAGAGATELRDLLQEVGCRLQVIEGGTAGDAVALKVLRSVFTKGMEALAVELLVSAEKQGVRERLYEQLGDIDRTPLRDFIDMLVRTHVIHAERRAHEVGAALDELKAQGLPSLVLPGVEKRFRHTASRLQSNAVGLAEPTIEQALEWLLATAPSA